jgi:hypothetical protein
MKEGREISQQGENLYRPGLIISEYRETKRLGTAKLCNSDKRHGVVMTVNGEYISSECSLPARLTHEHAECYVQASPAQKMSEKHLL